MKTFNASAAISKGWEITKNNLGLLVVMTIIVMLIPTIGQTILKTFGFGQGLASLASTLLSVFLSIGMMRVYLDLLTGKKADFNTLFSGADAFFDYFIAYIIYMIMVGVGMIFLILPGIYLALKYQYVFPLIIDKKMSAFDAIKKSGELTQGNIFNLFGLAVLLFLVILAGLLALGVGVLIAAPVASLAYVHVYKQLSK